MTGPVAIRRLFLIGVAIIAAALADPAVESIANSGVLGGHYADDNHLSVIPTVLLGGAFAVVVLVLRCFDMWRATARSRDWLIDVANGFSERAPAKDLPYVFAVQLAVLFVMESSEQFALGGKLPGGTAWLGGPVVFSLLTHAVVGALCLLVLGAFMRALMRTFVSFIETVIRYIWLGIARAPGTPHFGSRETPRIGSISTHVKQIGGRAPPLLQTLGLSYTS